MCHLARQIITMYRAYPAIKATSAINERVFSTASMYSQLLGIDASSILLTTVFCSEKRGALCRHVNLASVEDCFRKNNYNIDKKCTIIQPSS